MALGSENKEPKWPRGSRAPQNPKKELGRGCPCPTAPGSHPELRREEPSGRALCPQVRATSWHRSPARGAKVRVPPEGGNRAPSPLPSAPRGAGGTFLVCFVIFFSAQLRDGAGRASQTSGLLLADGGLNAPGGVRGSRVPLEQEQFVPRFWGEFQHSWVWGAGFAPRGHRLGSGGAGEGPGVVGSRGWRGPPVPRVVLGAQEGGKRLWRMGKLRHGASILAALPRGCPAPARGATPEW